MKKVMIMIGVAAVLVGTVRAAMFHDGGPWLAIVGFYLLGVLATYQFILWCNNGFDRAHASRCWHEISISSLPNQEPVEPCDGPHNTALNLRTVQGSECARVVNEGRTVPVAPGDLILNQPDIELPAREEIGEIASGFQNAIACDGGPAVGPEFTGTPAEAADPDSAKAVKKCSAGTRQFGEKRDLSPIRDQSPVEPEKATKASRQSRVLAVPTDDQKTCPKCGSKLVEKRVKQGANAGSLYWGCSTYPRCRYRVPRVAAKRQVLAAV